MYENLPPRISSRDEIEENADIEESWSAFGIGDLDSTHAVCLKDWSAQDFATIYVRLRPHLINHARKFLREETQAEEVVQDAFLYLMTALPELDSELGVLRFLKWKTKMLCLDIIRASQIGLNTNLMPLPDDIVDETQPQDSLERADDAAIIRLALAKLSARHRQALIATLYEEKSHEEVAREMGVGQNAFRQLLFRARASFRQALVGEAEIEGKSVAEILSVAARKVASARNVVVVTMLFLATVAISPMLNNNIQMADPGVVAAKPDKPDILPPRSTGAVPDSTEVITSQGVSSEDFPAIDIDNSLPADSLKNEGVNPVILAGKETRQSQVEGGDTETTLARDAFNNILDERMVSALASQGLLVSQSNTQVSAANQLGLQANFAIDLNSQQVVQFLVVEFESDSQVWKAVPGNSLSVVDEVEGKTFVSYAATDFLVGDFSGEFDYVSTTESVFSRSGIKLDLVIGGMGEIISSQVAFIPKT